MTETTSYTTKQGRLWVIDGGLVYGADPEVLVWMEPRIGPQAHIGVAIGVLKDGTDPKEVTEETLPTQLAAGAFFFNHQTGDISDIQVSVVADDITSATPDVFRRVLDYPFRQLGARRISAEIDLSNDRSIRQAQKLGFKLEGRKRRMGAGSGDVGVFGLLPDECPFWRVEA